MDEINMDNVNQLRFDREKFESDTQMFAAIAAFLQTLDKLEQVAVVRRDEIGVTVEYNPEDPAFGLPTPYWLYEDEITIEEVDDEY